MTAMMDDLNIIKKLRDKVIVKNRRGQRYRRSLRKICRERCKHEIFIASLR